MSTKSKINTGNPVPLKTQTRPKVITSTRKPESVRQNVKDKIEIEKKSKLEIRKTKTTASKEEKAKTTTKQMEIKSRISAKKPSAVKPSGIPSVVSHSKRIVKTQYFPSKTNYAEMLKHLNQYDLGSGDGDKKRGVTRESSSDSISSSERPRTSTLRKGSIVNENIAGPEIPKPPLPTEQTLEKDESEEEEYEDDFDSYESDFENISSSESTVHNLSEISTESTSSSSADEEHSSKTTPSAGKDLERKLDSGNFELKDNKNRDLSNLQHLMEEENSRLKRPGSNIKSNLTSLSDEGFEESKSLQFLNFVSAKRRNDRRKSLEMRKKRGEELLSMIKLDSVNFTVLDMPPVPYEQFIKTYGNVNSIQVGIQAGEEKTDEETQTDLVDCKEKWTQMPAHVSKDSKCYKFDRLGVGPPGEQMQELGGNPEPHFNEYRLNKFLSNTGGLILDILKEKRGKPSGNNMADVFSEAVTTLRPPTEFSAKRKVVKVVCNRKNPNMFLSVHMDEDNDGLSKSLVYVWDIGEGLPEEYLVCYGRIGSCCFGKDSKTFLAGLDDGSLVLWDTREKEKVTSKASPMVEGDVFLRNPNFVTDIETSHCTPVIALQCVSESNDNNIFEERESILKVCSLDQEGTIAIWSIMNDRKARELRSSENIKLLKNFEIQLRKLLPEMDDLRCNDMFVSTADSRTAFIATNYGKVIQCELNKDKTHVKLHCTEIVVSSVKCLVPCPFSGGYFLAGLENGSILLYSSKISKPLMVITNRDGKNFDDSIEEIQWSLERPCKFYTKNSNDVIDSWDLSRSSVFPIESLRMDEEITCMVLSGGFMDKAYMITSTGGTIRIHFLNQEHKRGSEEQYKREVNTFLMYVNRL